jgi:hypothetical protein
MSTKPRPYWHVNLKWIAGIGLFFALSAALLLYNLSALTERQRAVDISSTVVASLFSQGGLDVEKSLDNLRQNAALIPGDSVTPIEQLPWITISKADLATMSAQDLRLKIFDQLTRPIYDKGVVGAAQSFTSDPAQQQKFVQQASILGSLTNQTHQVLQTAFVIAVILAVVELAVLVFYSAGWGRLVSPAVVFLLVSPLGVITGLLLSHPPTSGNALLAALPSTITHEIGNMLSSSYSAVAVAGASLLLVALVGKVVQIILRRSKNPATK